MIIVLTLSLTLALAITQTITLTTYIALTSKAALKLAITACLKASDFDCSKGSHGPIGSWDVSAATDMMGLFNADEVPGANKFNADISKWDVSDVTTMQSTVVAHFVRQASRSNSVSGCFRVTTRWQPSLKPNVLSVLIHIG